MLIKQKAIANETKCFLHDSGLKARYVAERVGIHEQTFSKFVNNRVTLSDRQLKSLSNYMDDYKQRNDL